LGIITSKQLRNPKSCEEREDCLLIVNTMDCKKEEEGRNGGNSSSSSRHWVVFHFTEYGRRNYFFCSGGVAPEAYCPDYVSVLGKNYAYNELRIQMPNTQQCGLYCLLYIYYYYYYCHCQDFKNVLRLVYQTRSEVLVKVVEFYKEEFEYIFLLIYSSV
jgi:hypothetical protein